MQAAVPHWRFSHQHPRQRLHEVEFYIATSTSQIQQHNERVQDAAENLRLLMSLAIIFLIMLSTGFFAGYRSIFTAPIARAEYFDDFITVSTDDLFDNE